MLPQHMALAVATCFAMWMMHDDDDDVLVMDGKSSNVVETASCRRQDDNFYIDRQELKAMRLKMNIKMDDEVNFLISSQERVWMLVLVLKGRREWPR